MGKIKLRKEDLDVEYYQQIAEDYEKEENKEDYNLPEEWERDYKQIISHNLDKNARKRRLKRLSVAAAILLVVGVGSNMWSYQVSGTNVFELFSTSFKAGDYNHSITGADPDIDLNITNEEEETDIYFEGTTIDEVLSNIRETKKRPMFYFDDVFEEYQVIEAKYNSVFMITNIEIETVDGVSFLVEDDMYENSGVGIESDKRIAVTIRNENLNQDIMIYESPVEEIKQRYIFYVRIGNSQFYFDGAVSLDNCVELAKSINYH